MAENPVSGLIRRAVEGMRRRFRRRGAENTASSVVLPESPGDDDLLLVSVNGKWWWKYADDAQWSDTPIPPEAFRRSS